MGQSSLKVNHIALKVNHIVIVNETGVYHPLESLFVVFTSQIRLFVRLSSSTSTNLKLPISTIEYADLLNYS